MMYLKNVLTSMLLLKLETNVKNIFSKSLLTNKELLILYGIIKSLKNYEINN